MLTRRITTPSASSSRSRCESARSEISGIARRSSVKRRGPGRSARAIVPHQRLPISSTACWNCEAELLAVRVHRPSPTGARSTAARTQPSSSVEEPRVDRVRDRRLAVEHVRAGLLEDRPRAAAELHRDHRVERAVADRDGRERRSQVGLEALDDGDEPGERDDPRGPRPARPESERVRHHRALREAAEHRSLRRDPGLGGQVVEPARCEIERRPERRGVGEADLADDVPVRAAGRQRERPARRDSDQPPLGVEHVEQRVEVVLARTAAVEEDERPVRLAGRRADEVLEGAAAHLTAQSARGSGSGVTTFSTCSRRCS